MSETEVQFFIHSTRRRERVSLSERLNVFGPLHPVIRKRAQSRVTDIDCNDGLLLIDRIRDVLWSVNPVNRSRDLGIVDCNDGLLLMDSITTAGDCAGSSGGRPHWYPPPLGAPTHTHTPRTLIAETRLGLNQQPLNP
ncbi:unnamed protein product [Leuciscus chuanchicus]